MVTTGADGRAVYAPDKQLRKICLKMGMVFQLSLIHIYGTTDITRTMALGPLSDEQKLHFTTRCV